MIIDMREYGTELTYWVRAFESFVDRASQSALKKVLSDFEDGRENRDSFRWQTPNAIVLEIADAYDGITKKADRVRLNWSFHANFKKGTQPKRNPLWSVSDLVTHVKVFVLEPEEREILHFHHDLKAENQLGPHIHLQINEDFLCARDGVKLAVPRFPAAAVLPTDCLDLVLSEFFPRKWPEEQVKLTGIGHLREAQRKRFDLLADALRRHWDSAKTRTPIAATQNCFMPGVQLA